MTASTHNPLPTALLTVALALTSAGCADSLTGPEAEPTPEPVTVYDLDLTTRFIKVLGTCDGVFGKSADGEFQYLYWVRGAGQSYQRSTDNYNSAVSPHEQRGKDENIDFKNKTYRWRGLASPEGVVDITLYGAEWDGPVRDSRMNNRRASSAVVYETGKHTRTLTLGSGDCQIRLYYDATWTRRQTPG